MSTYATDTFVGDGSTVEFTLTFDYISRDHVEVYRVVTATGVEVKLAVIETGDPTGDEYIWETDQKIKVGTAPTSDQELKIERDTPKNDQIVDWSDGSYLIADDLNDSDKQWLYSIQELEDQISSIDGTVVGEAVKEVTGTEPVQVDNTDDQKPVISVDETKSTDDLNDLTSDTKLLSEKAADDAFSQLIGTGENNDATKIGRVRIDNTGSGSNRAFYWNGSAWVQVGTDEGPPGPPGPAPGLQDPAGIATTVDNKEDGSLGDATVVVSQDPDTSDLQFLFGVPAGIQGEQGPKGEQGEGTDYKGLTDATTDAEPTDPDNGDFYLNTTDGSSSWTGLSDVTDGDRLIWNEGDGQWDRFEAPDLGWLKEGDNVSLLENDAGYLTEDDVPAGTLQAVLDEGNTSTTDLFIGTGGETVQLANTGSVIASAGITGAFGTTENQLGNVMPRDDWSSLPTLGDDPGPGPGPDPGTPAVVITSSSFTSGAQIGTAYRYDAPACGGENTSVQLSWRFDDLPDGASIDSWEVSCIDTDADDFIHWSVTGISSTQTSIDEDGAWVAGATVNDTGYAPNPVNANGWGGPCPPANEEHTYEITVTARYTDGGAQSLTSNALTFVAGSGNGGGEGGGGGEDGTGTVTVTSTSFTDGAVIGQTYFFDQGNCGGDNTSPQLSWSVADLADGRSVASWQVTCIDNDAQGFVHWGVTQIPAAQTSIAESGTWQAGAQVGQNGFGVATPNGWAGPCPPELHNYQIVVRATLDDDTTIDSDAITFQAGS